MTTTPQAALLSDDELDALRQQAGGALNFVTLREFRAIAKAVTPAILAKLQATQEPVQAGELPDEREAFERFVQNCPMGRYSINRRDEGYDSSHTQIMWDAWKARAALAARKPLTGLTREQMEAGRHQVFSTNNPFCPCDSKTFRKVSEWTEREFCRINGLEVKP